MTEYEALRLDGETVGTFPTRHEAAGAAAVETRRMGYDDGAVQVRAVDA